MLDFFSTYLFGIIEDNTGLFLRGFKDFANVTLDNISIFTNQPFYFFTHLLFSKLSPVLEYNLILIITLLLTYITAVLLFRKFISNTVIVNLLSINVLFSGYLIYQTRSHLDLIQIWPVILFILCLYSARSLKNSILLGISLSVSLLFSNYLGFFSLLLFFITIASFVLGSYVLKDPALFKISDIKHYLLGFFVFLVLSSIFLYPYFKVIPTQNDLYSEKYNSLYMLRTQEDFFYFSSRPWYYILPSVDNLFLGSISQNILTHLEQDPSFWLAKNYFKSEHSASYLGLLNIFVFVLGVYFSIKKRNNITLPIILSIIILFLLSMPPFFTVSGIKIYMPSMLLYTYFPMFRSLARLGIIIYVLFLIIVGYGYEYIYNTFRNKYLASFIVFSIFLLNLFTFIIPLKLNHLGDIPEHYLYIKTNTEPDAKLVIYPYGKNQDPILWMTTHQRRILNTRYYKNAALDFDSEVFTETLNTCEGILEAAKYGGDYLLYFYTQDTSNPTTLAGFSKCPLLKELAKFDYKDNIDNEDYFFKLIKVYYNGNVTSNSVIIYKINCTESSYPCPTSTGL